MSPAFVIDIETIGDVTDRNREALTELAAHAERSAADYAALCPPLARVACIVGYDLAADHLEAFYDHSLGDAAAQPAALPFAAAQPPQRSDLYAAGNERELLLRFGERIERHMQRPQAHLVTFNGRGFDLPVLIHRSVKNGAAVLRACLTQILAAPRAATPPAHIDLMDTFTFNGITRRYSLSAYALGYDIASPKQSMSGSDVGPAIAAGRILDVVSYCAGDVLATAQLYRTWYS